MDLSKCSTSALFLPVSFLFHILPALIRKSCRKDLMSWNFVRLDRMYLCVAQRPHLSSFWHDFGDREGIWEVSVQIIIIVGVQYSGLPFRHQNFSARVREITASAAAVAILTGQFSGTFNFAPPASSTSWIIVVLVRLRCLKFCRLFFRNTHAVAVLFEPRLCLCIRVSCSNVEESD